MDKLLSYIGVGTGICSLIAFTISIIRISKQKGRIEEKNERDHIDLSLKIDNTNKEVKNIADSVDLQIKQASEIINNKVKSLCDRQVSDMEKVELKRQYVSDQLHTHISKNEDEHKEFKAVINSIDDKFNKIMSSISVLEERTKDK